MTKKHGAIDKPRASRDGHEYHEIWTARKATQLLWPDSDLTSIAIEGLSPRDQAKASSQAVEIADLTFYFGGHDFEQAAKTTYAQFKYSIANKDKDFRATHAKKTVEKFAQTYLEDKKQYGAKAVKEKLDFHIVTNQPISENLIKAIDNLSSNTLSTGDVGKQAEQFTKASGLTGKLLTAFAKKFQLIGQTGNLDYIKNHLASLLVDWSATYDPIASARLGQLKDLVREKAGYAGTGKNLITRTDVLAVLKIGDPSDLLPCAPAFVDIGSVLERKQLHEAIKHIRTQSLPLLIHASGGTGKTVFMDSLASKLANDYEIVFFDCFGGGAYRSSEDARHLPNKGLVHIANTLAFRGLCDPILPDSTDLQSLLRTFRRRLKQSVSTLSRMTLRKKLVLFIDAIDNAEFAASLHGEDCFPIKLMESLDTEPVLDVKLVVSCRTERKPSTYAQYNGLELQPFSNDETSSFLRARLKKVSLTEINVAQARSGGNPRVLEYLLKSGRGLLDESEIEKKLELDDLIQKRITDSLSTAMKRGYTKEDIHTFLAGLAVLPPPVPFEEYAEAQGIEISSIESFASDLNPLLERTNQGLMFRDEPTETLVHNQYASSLETLRRVAENLQTRQDQSIYAARALPGLLHKLDDEKQLLALAFDNRFPSSIPSTVGKRNIRYARLKTATLHAALNKNYDNLVQLLLEFSTVASVDQRGTGYILDHPDLVVIAQDVDAMRRLFEVRTSWPGTRHARLTVANVLFGDYEEAYRHARLGDDWINHHFRKSKESDVDKPRPGRIDIAALPFFLISKGRSNEAAKYLKKWRDWYVYEVCEFIFRFSNSEQSLHPQSTQHLKMFVDQLSDIGTLTAALSFKAFPQQKEKELISKLAKRCQNATKLDFAQPQYRESSHNIQDGLRKAATIALTLGLTNEAMGISLRAPHKRPALWAFRDSLSKLEVFSFLFRVALRAAAKKEAIHEKDILPSELFAACSRVSKKYSDKEFIKRVKIRISGCIYSEKDSEEEKHSKTFSYDDSQRAERFLDHRFKPLLAMTRAFSTALGASSYTYDKAFLELIQTWENTSKGHSPYNHEGNHYFFGMLGLDMVLFCLWSRSDLKPESVKELLVTFGKKTVPTQSLISVIAILSQKERLHTLAGEQAARARELIEREDDINSRASLYGSLARAISPASRSESSAYFRLGLEQMEAIGSGDYQFTNELLLFASELKGDELDESDFHTLSNICELNIGDESEKFFWGAYGRGLSKASGLRGLAKLSRWDDRARISLDYTLLPYLTGLLKSEKISSKDALSLNRLANPVEHYSAGTKEFAETLPQSDKTDPLVVEELISQYRDNNPDMPMDNTLEVLSSLAKETLGLTSETTEFLETARKSCRHIRDTKNERQNHGHTSDQEWKDKAEERNRNDKEKLEQIAATTIPTDEISLTQAIEDFNALGNMYDLKSDFFKNLRSKVSYSDREKYIRNVAQLENLFYYWKFAELNEAKQEWKGSSISLKDVFKSLATPLISAHGYDFIDHGTLSGSNIKKISDLTNVPMSYLVIELIKVFARTDSSIPGSVWLGFATFVCSETEEGNGQKSLKRLLSSQASVLANNVIDGTWKNGLYPKSDFVEIASGLVWRILGSPNATYRWSGAHSIRSFAKFGRWEVIDSLTGKLELTDGASFQAKELPFFFMHAQLWLLISLARIAMDYPAEISRYKDKLLSFALEDNKPHALMRHFASKALISCVESGFLELSDTLYNIVCNVHISPHPRLNKKIRGNSGFYSSRPELEPEPPFKFTLEYDFHKNDVNSLSRIFGQPCWKVSDSMSKIVNDIDSSVETMHDLKGRNSKRSMRMTGGIDDHHHTYGQQLGYHALFISAGILLKDYPITDDAWYEEEPWDEWLSRYTLTRSDGLWLADGVDRTPVDTQKFLLEGKGRGLTVTGDRDRILKLAGFSSSINTELVIDGDWLSADNVKVKISSALVSKSQAKVLAKKLINKEPFNVWLPSAGEGESHKKGYTPWVVCPSGEAKIDDFDPYGVPCANQRSYLSNQFTDFCSLSKADPFGRTWKDKHGQVALRAQAWGREDKNQDISAQTGTRLFCTSSTLEAILSEYEKDLIILINLQRYEKKTYDIKSKFTNTIAVIRVNKTLEFEYFEGLINHQLKMDF